MTSNSGTKEKSEEISLKDILLKLQEWMSYLTRKWKWILLFTVAGVILGLTYAFLKRPQYTATITFVTETKGQSSTLGAYAGLAAQFGFNIGGGGGSNDLFSGDNIFDLMRTRLMLQKALLTPVTVDGRKTLFINWFIQVNKLLKRNPKWAKVSFNDPPRDSAGFDQVQNGIIKSVCGAITNNLKFSRGSIMGVSLTSPDELFAIDFLETLIQNTGQFYILTRTKKSRENVDILQRQLDSVKNQLYGAMGSVASFEDLNPNLVRQLPRVQQQKSSMRVNVNSAIYQQLITGLEAAKMALLKETPLFEIIDEPVLPLDKKSPGKVKWGIAGAFLGIFLSCGWFLLRKIYGEIMAGE